MNPIQQTLAEDQRLVILRSLIDMGGTANESVLQTCVNAFGHRASRDVIRAHLGWLSDVGLVRNKSVLECMVAEITGRGEDIAFGNAVIHGVKKPRATD